MAKNQAPQALDVNATISKTEAFVNRNKNIILGCLAAVVVLVAAGFGGHSWLKNRNEKGSEQIGLSMPYLMQNSDEGYTKALNGEGQYKGFLKIAKDYSFTSAANLAHGYAGECYAHLGKYKEAIKELEAFSPKGDNSISPALIGCLADCYVADKQLDKAVSTFKKAAKMADNESFSPVFLLKAAQILESEGNTEDAKALYEQIKSDYPTSSLAMPQQQGAGFAAPEIDKYIERATK